MTPMRDLVAALDERLGRSLHRFSVGADSFALTLPAPSRLAERALAVVRLFDEGAPPEPPSQARIDAIARLRKGNSAVSHKDWQLIAWGLCDECGRAGMPINDRVLFEKIMQYVDGEAVTGIGRKVWFGLLHSYFACPDAVPRHNPNWLTLRQKLELTLPALVQRLARPKSWAQALVRHADLLTDQAGVQLAQALATNDDALSRDVTTYLPIPETSWLWRDMIERRLAMLASTSDVEFKLAIPALLDLSARHAMQSDRILAAVLTRYADADFSKEAHLQLKQAALDRWQNPQVKTANRWSLVEDDVRRMVLQWFAKADLEHFFSLLQGEGDVDDARLHYWLRFVDQISYTRIVMGQDAFMNPSPDFVDFRKKNKGRFSRLSSPITSNNAFIMQIGDYCFVEFSGTGNACYVYSQMNLPFNPELANFTLFDLKNKNRATTRVLHNGSWQYRADRDLAKLSLAAGQGTRSIRRESRPRALAPLPAPTPAPTIRTPARPTQTGSCTETYIAPSAPMVPPAPTIQAPGWPSPTGQLSARQLAASNNRTAGSGREDRIAEAVCGASVLAIRHNIQQDDRRAKGGAFWMLDNGKDQDVRRQLIQLGFAYVPNRGFWIK
jgi:hypothetical protein